MSIEKIVDQALQDGYLTPSMEAEVGRICNTASELSIEEYMALDRLMGALLTGEVVVLPRKQFINVMEELVLSEAIAKVAEIEDSNDRPVDVGDIAAYALNRLPPLYATTEEGAQYQRARAREELQEPISTQVKDAIAISIDQAAPHPTSFGQSSGQEMVTKMTNLLKVYAEEFEQNSEAYSAAQGNQGQGTGNRE